MEFLFFPMVLCTFANKGRSWERRENRGNIDKAKGLYDLDQDAGEDLEMTATETGFTTANVIVLPQRKVQ